MASDLPGSYGLNIYQGDRIEKAFRLRDAEYDSQGKIIPGDYKDLTGYTAQAEIRKSKGQSIPDASFTCTIDPDQITNAGLVTIVLLPADCKALNEGGYLWDLQLKLDAAHIKTYLAGPVVVIGEVTDDA
jgi:hypothetical protein